MKNLFEHATKQELILEDIFLSEDTEEISHNVYAEAPKSDGSITMYAVNFETNEVKTYILKEEQDLISTRDRNEILNYRLSKVDDDDFVTLGDIFVYGKHIERVR